LGKTDLKFLVYFCKLCITFKETTWAGR